jgi:hypothetical protein
MLKLRYWYAGSNTKTFNAKCLMLMKLRVEFLVIIESRQQSDKIIWTFSCRKLTSIWWIIPVKQLLYDVSLHDHTWRINMMCLELSRIILYVLIYFAYLYLFFKLRNQSCVLWIIILHTSYCGQDKIHFVEKEKWEKKMQINLV